MAITEEALVTVLSAFRRNLMEDVYRAIASVQPPLARHGVVQLGSYNPEQGTVSVNVGDTVSMFQDDGDQPVTLDNVPLLTQSGQQYGPVGGEPIVLIPTQAGFVAKMHHVFPGDPAGVDSPGAAAGEHWFTHRASTGPTGFEYNGVVNAFIKLLNDGAVSGDGAGGIAILSGSKFSLATAGGIMVTADDNLQRVTLETAGGHQLVMDDQGKTLSLKSAGGLEFALNDNSGEAMIGKAGGTFKAIPAVDEVQAAITAVCAAAQPGSGITPVPVVGASTSVEETE